ncbi:MAG: endo-1,4-beta-xylanase [Sedimentisphaerales bacterium]|nr:endo-1,4-beta-xylanase [Sedimentisphaerales bacterium]
MKLRLVVVLSAAAVVSGVCRGGSDVGSKVSEEAIAARIREHRMGEIIVKTAAGAEVKVEQVRHAFWFGTAVSNSIAQGSFRRGMSEGDRDKYITTLKANFNSAVHENALKWHNCQRTQAAADYSTADAIYRICSENGIGMRGHCIFWCTDGQVQGWVKNLDKEAMREAVKTRALDVTSRFKGRIEEFDLNNELLFGNFYRRNLGEGIIKDMADWAKEGNPKAKLYLNEQGALAGGVRNADRYVALIKKTLDDGVKIDGIGCQGHFREMFDGAKLQGTLDKLGEFGLPIKITEYDFDSGDEQAKAEHLRQFYSICFAHPAVEGIIMWGFWEGAHWRPRAALWKRDWTATPAARTYRDLVFKKWWTVETGKADEKGVYRTRAFYGRHKVLSGGITREVCVTRDNPSETVDF